MKTIPGGLASQVGPYSNQDVLTHWATCWSIVRADTTAFYFTDHDQPITVSGHAYQPALSISRTAKRTDSEFKTDQVEVVGVLSSDTITDDDLRDGLYDHAVVTMFLVDYTSPGSGIIKLGTGTIGVVERSQNSYKAEVTGLSRAFETVIGKYFSPTCRAQLGDAQCTIDLGPLTQTGAVIGVTDDRNFTASGLTGAGPVVVSYSARTISFLGPHYINDSANGFGVFSAGTGITITGSKSNDTEHYVNAVSAGVMHVDAGCSYEAAGHLITIKSEVAAYFTFGTLTWLTGGNAGLSMDITAWDGISALTALLKAPNPITIGDTFSIVPGCDKRVQTCFTKFNNVIHFRGEPFVPGESAILAYPNVGD